MKAKIIVLFNHKGGVSKTTTTFNIAWKLTQLGKRVLIVDGDPQCNLTGMFLGEQFDEYYENENTSKFNLKDAVSMAFKGRPRPIEAIECVENVKNADLFLIPGHMDLSEYESSLSLALNSNNAIVTLQNLPGAFYELIRLCSEKYDIDYVFIDMNPGLSAINQTFFMYTDAFLIPTNPDPFSVMALKTLKTVLPRWKKWAIQGRELFAEAAYPLPECDMKFIGEIIQRFNVRNKKAAKPYTGKIDEIKDYIDNDLVNELEKYNMSFDITPIITKGILNNRCLAEIAEFGSLLQKANEAGVPVFALTKKDMGAVGNVYDSMEAKRKLFDDEFSRIANVIMELL
ncbi:ParA family protein [Robinsoniella sp. KNHs210]|uniref:ParA family protein n=1 Tax=Robinsoniella sp. KNHs210 TaxID=1469950 RepID=UPI0004812CB4|nr:ParA family protein [Robinsoniella sp. KNHs210]